jgi:hypothetical protein
MTLFEGTMPATDVVICLVAVLFMAGILCTFFLSSSKRYRRHIHCGCPYKQETYIDYPPLRNKEVVDRPVLQSPDKCKTDYQLCMASLGPVNEQTVLKNKPVRTVSYPLDVLSGVERRLADSKPPMAPFSLPQIPTNMMTR